MRRGTTSTIIFTLPQEVSVANLADARVSIHQGRHRAIDRPLSTMEIDSVENTLQLQLTQEETLRLHSHRPAEVQLKVKLIGGDILATPIYRAPVDAILNQEVI